MSIFEAGMMVCFGASWPFALIKTFKSKDVEGISPLFLYLLLLGYVFGILHKILYNMDYVILIYLLNSIFVFAEIVMYYMYKDKQFLNKQK
jgi:uncharacterized protein with PQ loop repeat